MARIKGGMNAKKKHNRVLKLAKCYRGARSKQYRVAKQSVMRALTSAYAGRKQKKRQFRQLWIARINAAARINGLSYSKFMYGLKLAGVEMNRKMLAEMAVNDAEVFAPIITIRNSYAKTNLEHPIRFLDDPVLAFDKFIILTDTNSDIDLFHTKLKDNFDFIIREEMHPYGFEEIVPKGCSKASGIDFIVKHLKASLDDCYVFGDSTNDLSMLTHVKNSIAMGNAYPEVLRNTSYVTTPIDRDGIRNALKHFKLI